MTHKIGRKTFRIYAFDVESNNDKWSVEHKETAIWLASFIDETNQPFEMRNFFRNIPDFLDMLEKESSKKIVNGKRPINNIAIYIYNLSFEWSFLLPELLKRGIKWKERIDWKKDSYCFSTVSTKSVSSVWNVSLKFGLKSGEIIFRDLCKIFPSGLRNIAKSFDLPTQKGEIDYEKDRRKPDYEITNEEYYYNFKDTRIIIDILLKLQDDKDFWKATSTASYSVSKLLKFAYPKSYKPLERYRKDYPKLGRTESDFLRKSVGGGITYATPDYQFKDVYNIGHIDAHQMHPSQIVNHLFPFGYGEYHKGKPNFKHARRYCCHIKVSYSGVKLHSIIKLIGYELASDFELWVWDFEIPTMKKCYIDLEIKYIDYYEYHVKKVPWADFCADNYAKRKIAKAKKDNFGIMYYKLLNNSGAYGKFLERPHEEVFENIINADGKIDSIIHDKTKSEYEKQQKNDLGQEDCNATYTYLPYGSCIPAWSRVCLIETALKFGYQNIVYFDTDSIFYIKNDETDKVLKTLDTRDELGCWGVENDIKVGEFSASKRYKITEINPKTKKEETVIHMAGINFDNDNKDYFKTNIDDDDYIIQRIMRVKGGTIIVKEKKHIGIQDKYQLIYRNNKVAVDDK